jgi:tyrosyl-tRNA synthetase
MRSSLFDLLSARAVQIHVADHLRERLERGEKLRVKLGCDPTAPDLHIGHLVQLDVLRAFQDDGHTVVYIVGDYTALIGDPSGKSETRPMLTRAQVEENARSYFDQVYKVLDPDRTEVHGNAEWLGEMTPADILRLLATHTLQQVMHREDFADRWREGTAIGVHELLYPFNQAYDSVAVRADVEIGGTDQLFNLLFGREIQQAYGQPPQDICVFPLLEGLDGVEKMSKSLGNYIGLAEPAEEIYGKTMSIPDRMTERYLRLVSGLGAEEIDAILAEGPRDAKAALARQLVHRLHGEAAVAEAEADFDRKFRRRELDPEQIPTIDVTPGQTVAEVLVGAGEEPSVARVRRLAEQGGLSIDGQKITFDHRLNGGEVVKYGKRRWMRAVARPKVG